MPATRLMGRNWSWESAIREILQRQVDRRGRKHVARDCGGVPPDTMKKWQYGHARTPFAPAAELIAADSEARLEFLLLLLDQKPEARVELLRALEERACGSRSR